MSLSTITMEVNDYDDLVNRVEGNYDSDNDDYNEYFQQAADGNDAGDGESETRADIDPQVRQLINNNIEYIHNCEGRMRQSIKNSGGNSGFRSSMQPVLTAARNNNHVGVFATPGIHKRRSIRAGSAQFIKKYIAAGYKKLFQFCISERSFAIDEVVRVNKNIPLHFDIEIKAEEALPTGNAYQLQRAELERQLRYDRALRALRVHVSDGSTFLSSMTTQPSVEVLQSVARKYVSLSAREWTEGECQAGVGIMKSSIESIVLTMLMEVAEDRGVLCDEFNQVVASDMTVLSACRPGKFSLHVIMQRLFCDSQVVSMPLVAFEIARSFAQLNALTLFTMIANNGWEIQDNDEINFRIRAMMLSGLLDDDGYVRGYNDTPFDEQIYSRNHLFRLPGGLKMSENSVGPVGVPMSPVIEGGAVMMGERTFAESYPSTSEGYRNWLKGSVMGSAFLRQMDEATFSSLDDDEEEQQIVLVEGMPLSPAYPRKRGWWNDKRQYDQERRGMPTSDIQGLHQIMGVKHTIAWAPLRYTESRHSRPREAVDDARGANNLPWERGDGEDGVVTRDEVFTSESGEEKPFHRFKAGEWFKHVHGGVEENTASAKSFGTGFRCFGCNRTFYLPVTSPFEPPYPFRDTAGVDNETFRSNDPDAYIPPDIITWSKWYKDAVNETGPRNIVIDAPKGSGKTEICAQLTELFGYKPQRAPNDEEGSAAEWHGNVRIRREIGLDQSYCVLCDYDDVLDGKCAHRRKTPQEIENFRQRYTSEGQALCAMVNEWKPQDLCTKCGTNVTHYQCQKEYETKHPRNQAGGGGLQNGIQVICAKCTKAVGSKASICVVSFRQALARQQAKRLGLECYMDMKDVEIDSDGVVVCVNSVGRLAEHKRYDIVILDEAGLVRRHFVSPVTERVLAQAYERFSSLLQEAKMVVMLQHSLTLEDIRFYTRMRGVDPEDRKTVLAIRFRKPVRQHPIRVVEEFPKLVFEMLRVYREAIVDGKCTRPFMVFCSSSAVAGALQYLLREEAAACGGVPSRIQLLTRGMKTTEFNKRFLGDSNRHSSEADVVVCTSVVGAGFDISTHFHCYFAFLFNNILPFPDERQFVARLRLLAENRWYDDMGAVTRSESLPEGDSRQSYLWVENGFGSLAVYNNVATAHDNLRKLLRKEAIKPSSIVNDPSTVNSLASVAAQSVVESTATNAHHRDLWRSYLQFIRSDLQRVELNYVINMSEGDMKKMIKRISAYKNKVQLQTLHFHFEPTYDNTEDYLTHLKELCKSIGADDVSAETGVDVVASTLALDQCTAVNQLVDNFNTNFKSLIRRCFPKHDVAKHPDETLHNSWVSKAKSRITRAARLGSWLFFHYKPLSTDYNPALLQMQQEADNLRAFFSNARMQNWRKFTLACKLLPMLLSPVGDEKKIAYVVQVGTLPFFSNASVVQDKSLCQFLVDYYDNHPADQPLFTDGRRPSHWRTCPKKAHEFIKTLCDAVGLTMRTNKQTTKRHNVLLSFNSFEMTIMELSTLLALKAKRHNDLKSVFMLLAHHQSHNTNLIPDDHAMFRSAIRAYNECYPESQVMIGSQNLVIPTVPRRLAELRRDTPPTNVTVNTDDVADDDDDDNREYYNPREIEVARFMADDLYDRANHAEAVANAAAEAHVHNVLANVDTTQPDNPRKRKSKRNRKGKRKQRCSRFIDDEAQQSDDDDDDDDNTDEDSDEYNSDDTDDDDDDDVAGGAAVPDNGELVDTDDDDDDDDDEAVGNCGAAVPDNGELVDTDDDDDEGSDDSADNDDTSPAANDDLVDTDADDNDDDDDDDEQSVSSECRAGGISPAWGSKDWFRMISVRMHRQLDRGTITQPVLEQLFTDAYHSDTTPRLFVTELESHISQRLTATQRQNIKTILKGREC